MLAQAKTCYPLTDAKLSLWPQPSATPDGRVAQRSALTLAPIPILGALQLPEPSRFFEVTLPAAGFNRCE